MHSNQGCALSLASTLNSPIMWLRYVNYTFVKIGEDYVEEFSNHIDTQDPNIKFT